MDNPDEGAKAWLNAELEDSAAEEYELELSDTPLANQIGRVYRKKHPTTLDGKE
jgi:hypothetical protein